MTTRFWDGEEGEVAKKKRFFDAQDLFSIPGFRGTFKAAYDTKSIYEKKAMSILPHSFHELLAKALDSCLNAGDS